MSEFARGSTTAVRDPPVTRAPRRRGRARAATGIPAGLQVLLVDDDEDMRDALKVILEQSGIRVAARGSAKEAFEAFHDVRPDVLLCDIAMPGEDGLSLIRRVRSLPPERGGDVPAAAISAFTGAEDRRTARLAGFHYHVAKPVDPQRLLALIATMARARRLPARSASVPVSRG